MANDISNNLGNPQASEIAVEAVIPFVGNDVRETLQDTLTASDALLAKRYEDRNLFLTQGGLLTYDGTQLTMTEDLKIEVNQKVAGGSPTLIDLGPGPFNVAADGNMIYAVIDRIAGTATVLDNQTTLPAVVAPNYEVFLLAKRRDATDGTSRLYFLDGSAVNAGQTVRLGATGAPETSLTGDDLTDLTFLADFQDGFFNLPGGSETSTLPNSIVVQTSNANPYAGGNLETVASGVATPVSGSDAYFVIDAAGTGSSGNAVNYGNANTFNQYLTNASKSSQPFSSLLTGSLTQGSVIIQASSSGSVSGNIILSVYTDNAGVPGTLIASSAPINASTLSTIATFTTFTFSSGSVTSGTTYHLVADYTGVTFSGGGGILQTGADTGLLLPDAIFTVNNGSTWNQLQTGGSPENLRVQLVVGGSTPFTITNTSVNTTSVDSTNTTFIGQTFTSTGTGTLTDAKLQLSVTLASPSNSGSLVVKIYADSSGQPGSLIATSSALNSASLTTTPTLYTFTFSSGSLTSGSIYHLVLDSSALTGTVSGGAPIPVNTDAGFTKASNYSVVHRLWKLTYDASKTMTGTGINVNLSATPSYTVSLGDIVRIGDEARRISTLNSQTSYTLEAAFTVDPSATPCTVSQCLYTRDINNFAPPGENAISAALPGDIAEVLVAYTDNNISNSAEQSLGVVPNIAWVASSDGSTYTGVQERPENLTDELFSAVLPTSGTNMFIRFFSNATAGSGFANVLNYKAYFHKESGEEEGSLLNQAYANLNSSGTQQNCSLSIFGGKTLVTLTNGFVYSVGLNPGLAQGQLDIYIDGQMIDRFVDSTTTPFASYQEVDAQRFLLDSDYSGLNKSLKVLQRVGVIDSSDQNTTNIAQIQANTHLNLVDNPEGYVMQRIDPVNGTIITNNVYGADRWKFQCSSAGGTIKRVASTSAGTSTALQTNVATSAGFIGQAQFKEASESQALQGQLITFGVSAKSSNSTVSQIRLTILGWEGTADAPNTNLVSSWASSPSYVANYNVYGTTTMTINNGFSYGEVSAIIGENCQNLVFFISTTSSQAPGNLLELTGMQANFGASLLPYHRQSSDAQLARCSRYFEKSYDPDTPISAITAVGAFEVQVFNTWLSPISYRFSKFQPGSPTTLSQATGATGVGFDASSSSDFGISMSTPGCNGVSVRSASTTAQNNHTVTYHWYVDSDL